MKRMIRCVLWLFIVLPATAGGLMAQSNFIQVHVTVTPPYQQSIVDYQSRPNQVVIILTNLSRLSRNVQLRARLTGDNGVVIRTKAGYRSPRPIQLEGGQVLRLTAEGIMELFNMNSLEFINVKSSDITRHGTLPEGRYRLCVEPLDYGQQFPIGQELCSNEFPVQSLEPPVIIKPFQEESVAALLPQNLLFTWTTPPSAPPSTEYVFRIVEVVGNRNPNDAILSNTRINSLEEVVRTNAFLYSPAYPALVAGRRYAVQVTARDPNLGTIFRNNGKSEVVVFTYGDTVSRGGGATASGNKPPSPVQLATHTIKGRLLWAFKRTEELYSGPAASFRSAAAVTLNQVLVSHAGRLSAGQPPASSPAVMEYAGHQVLQSLMPTALGQADPTMRSSYRISTFATGVAGETLRAPEPDDIISSKGASTLAYSYENIRVDTGAKRYPLANVTVIIKGERDVSKPAPSSLALANQLPGGAIRSMITPQVQAKMLGLRVMGATRLATTATAATTAGAAAAASTSVLATGRTDAEGNFSIGLLNPAYEGLNTYKNIIITVSSYDFESREIRIPASELAGKELIDLGTQILLANTYRFAPKLNPEQQEGATVENPTVIVRVYREAADIDNHPYLQQEGNVPAGERKVTMIGGRRMVPVSVDSLRQNGIVSMRVNAVEFGFARLFYKGRLLVEISSSSGSFVKRTTELGVTDPDIASHQMLVVKPTYDLKLKFPAVSGQVMMYAGASIVPVPGAVVKVEFNKEDVLATPVGVSGSVVGNLVLSAFAKTPVKVATGNSRSGTMAATASSLTSVRPVSMAALSSPYSIAAPVMISPGIANALAGSFNYTPVLADIDETKSAGELVAKYGSYTVKTDSSGQFYLSNLPVLKAGATFTLKLVSVPHQYRDMEVMPANKTHTLTVVKGSSEFREFGIRPEVVNVVGRVVDEQRTALPYARLHFKGSTSYFDAGETGLFQTSYFPGRHVLVIEKEGYVTKEQTITIASGSSGAGNNAPQPAGALTIYKTTGFASSLAVTNTVKKALQAGYSLTPALFGKAAPVKMTVAATAASPGSAQLSTAALSSADKLFGPVAAAALHDNVYAYIAPKTTDLDDVGFLLRRTGKVRFRIVDKDNNQAIAQAQVGLFDTTHATDAAGMWQYEGLGGHATVTITPPSGSGYVPLLTTVTVHENGLVTEVVLKLEKGVRVHGRITSGGQPLAGGRVEADGLSYLQATADASGNYELYLPAGEQVIKAAKSGYYSQTENRILVKGSPLLLNFDLAGGGGRNISTLLGFSIELDHSTPDGAGARWTGRFVNLTPVSGAFVIPGTTGLSFSNIRVSFDASGNALPQGNEVATDAVTLPLKLFGYLPAVLGGSPVIKVTAGSDGKGVIKGMLSVDVNQLQGSRGFAFSKTVPLYVVPSGVSSPAAVEVFRAGAGAGGQAPASMKLTQAPGPEASLDLYGFAVSLDLTQSSIGSNGLSLAGAVNTPALGPISAIKLGIEEFMINKELRIQAVRLKNTNLPSLSIAGWSASLANVVFSESGFKLGGNIKVSLPGSAPSAIDFSNLTLSRDALYGGQFAFPAEGINLLNIVKLQSGGQPLSFGRVGNTQVYSLGGSASLKFDQLITKTINLPLFQVQTDGRFMIQAPVNFSADMGFAKFAVQNLVVSTASGEAPYIGVLGEFKSDLSMLKFNAADIRFRAKAGGGTEFSVGSIAAMLDLPVMKVGLQIGLMPNGFSGAGTLGIPSTPISAAVAFHYYKVAGGIDVGASFKSGIVIPIGLVTIEQVGGGFAYNTATKSFMININGAASITGTGTAVRLNPIGLTVESGPVIKGYAGIEILSAFSVARAAMVLDVPGKTFAVTIDAQVSPIPGLASSSLKGLLRISWNRDDPFVFLGCGMQARMLGVLDSYGEYALGINLRNPRGRGDDISYYFSHLDNDLAQTDNALFTGVYLHTGYKLGNRNRKYGFDISIASAQFWYESSSEVLLFLNFAQREYKFKLKGYLGAGAELCAVKVCVGAGFEACYGLMGGRDDANGWYVGGQVAGSFNVKLGGCNPGCNSVSLCAPWDGGLGGRVCANAHANIHISQRQGVSLSGGAGGNPNFNGCN